MSDNNSGCGCGMIIAFAAVAGIGGGCVWNHHSKYEHELRMQEIRAQTSGHGPQCQGMNKDGSVTWQDCHPPAP